MSSLQRIDYEAVAAAVVAKAKARGSGDGGDGENPKKRKADPSDSCGDRTESQPMQSKRKFHKPKRKFKCLHCSRPGHRWNTCKEICQHCGTKDHYGTRCNGPDRNSARWYRRKGPGTWPGPSPSPPPRVRRSQQPASPQAGPQIKGEGDAKDPCIKEESASPGHSKNIPAANMEEESSPSSISAQSANLNAQIAELSAEIAISRRALGGQEANKRGVEKQKAMLHHMPPPGAPTGPRSLVNNTGRAQNAAASLRGTAGHSRGGRGGFARRGYGFTGRFGGYIGRSG